MRVKILCSETSCIIHRWKELIESCWLVSSLSPMVLSWRSYGPAKLRKWPLFNGLCLRVPGILESKFWQHLVPRIFSDKISVLLEHAAQSVTQERSLKLWNVTWLLRASVRALRALTRAASRDLFLRKMASPALLNERDAPVVRLSWLKKCEKQDAAKIFNPKSPEHECRAYFMSKKANFGLKWRLSSHWTSHLLW